MTATIDEPNTIILTYKYRLLPTKKQHGELATILESQRILYNAALQERIDCYRKTGKTLTYIDQFRELTELRREAEYAAVPLRLQRWTLKRLDDAFVGFFRRVKAKGDRAGYPRFRGKGRWQSFGFSEFHGIRLESNRLRFAGLSLRLHLHRPLPDGKPIGCTLTRDSKGWYVCLLYCVRCEAKPATGRSVGVDMGIKELAVLSTGEAIPNPRVAKKAEKELRRRQRALARCKHGSRRRRKVKTSLMQLHTRIASTRRTGLHQVSARLVREYDLIAIEKLNVKGLAGGMLAKQVHDAGWSTLKRMLVYKAAWAGRQLIQVDPRNTSQACSGCGDLVPKKLSDRWHCCPSCGLKMDRDENAARNVLRRAVLSPGHLNQSRLAMDDAGNISLGQSPERHSTVYRRG